MSAYATVDDYIKRTGRTSLSTAQLNQVSALLDDASALIRSKLPTGYEPDPDLARATTVTLVIRAVTNPGGRRSRTVGGVSETYDQDGGLYLTDEELETLLAAWEEGASGAYTVGLRDEAFPPSLYGPSPYGGRYGDDRW